MANAIIALPISDTDMDRHDFYEGWPSEWTEHGFGPTKNIRWLGNLRYSKAKVKTFQLPSGGLKLMAGILITTLVQVKDSHNFNFVVVCLNVEHEFDTFGKLLKPGNRANSKLFLEKVGVTLDGSAFVNGTCAINGRPGESSAKDGLLHTHVGSSDFYFEVAYGLGIAGITAERMLLENATKASFNPGVFAGRARNSLTLTEGWLSTPASDSTQILRDMNLLRESLHLDQRMIQVRRSLRHQDMKVKYFLSYAISIPTLITTAIATAVTLKLSLTNALITVAIAVVAIVASVTIWVLLNKRNR